MTPAGNDLEIRGSFGAHTVIGRSAIFVRTWRGQERNIGKLELAGYRTGVGRGVVYFYLVPLDPLQKKITVAVASGKKDRVVAALAPLKDLDAADLAAATEAIRQSDSWGLRPEERMANLATEKRVVLGVNILAGVIAAWALLYPHPRMWAIAACAAAVVLVLVATVLKQGRWRINLNKNDPRPSVAIALLACIIGVAARAAFDVDTFDWQPWLAAAALVGVAGAVVMPMLFAELKSKGALVTVAIFAFVFGVGCIGAANTLFDHSTAQIYKAELVDKYETHGRSTSYTWVLAPWGPSHGGSEGVDSDLYDQLNTGEVACVYFHPGALHMRWYTVSTCAWEKPL